MALVRRSSGERYNSTSSVTRSSRSSRSSSSKTSGYYEAKSTVDSNNNSIKASAVVSASFSKSSSTASSPKKRSSIPIRKGAASPSKSLSPTREFEDSSKRAVGGFEAEDSEETPKLHRKVKKRLGRKPKRRNNAIVGQDNGSRNGRRYLNADENSSESEDEFFDENNGNENAPRISITPHKPTVTVTRPLQITYRTPTSTDDDSRKQRRSRDERPKTLPITFTVKQPTVKANNTEEADDSDEDTLTSGGEFSERDEKRTSIRIVSSSARSSDAEGSTKKLKIEAKSFKRKAKKENEHSVTEQEARSERANKFYKDKTRNLISREPWKQQKVVEKKFQPLQLQGAESAPENTFRTLPRNFKTVRVPIQTPTSPKEEKPDRGRRLSQPIDLRELTTPSSGKADDFSDTGKSASVSSVKSHDASPTGQVHQCRRGCTHVVDDTADGPRIIRRSRENRRKSNPNQILGRTDIQGLRKNRPKSEIIRSLSLPRSKDRPRLKSEGFEEFVEINDLGEFSRSKSRTLPNRKKRVTYHEGTKDDFQAFSESEAQNSEFERHLLIHQNFTENAQRNLTATEEQTYRADQGHYSNSKGGYGQETQERAKEIRRKSRDQIDNQNTKAIGFRNSKESKQQERKAEGVQFSETRDKTRHIQQETEVRGQKLREVEGQIKVEKSRVVEGQVKREVKSQHQNHFEEGRTVGSNHVKRKEEERQDRFVEGKRKNENRIEKKERERVKEEIIEEHIKARRLSEQKEEEKKKKEEITVTRSQTLPRKANKQEYQEEKEREFEEFIRNQRNLLLNQLYKREQGQGSNSTEVKGKSSKEEKFKGEENNKQKAVEEEVLVSSKAETENSGRRIDEFLKFPEASKNKRRHKSSNDASSIQEAKLQYKNKDSKDHRSQNTEVKVQRSHSSAAKVQRSIYEQAQFLLQNNEEAKVFEQNQENKEDIIRVFSRGGVIQLSMETVDRERFEQRQREYEELQKRRSVHQQEHRTINDDRYRYINNEFDKKSNGYYYNEQRFDPGNRSFKTYHDNNNGEIDDDVFEERMETNSTQITKIKRDQIKGQLDKVHYTICTHYFYPEDHELIVNLHRLGKIEVPRGLSHQDTCIFYNHLYVYENEEVFAETLAPIMPTIKTEVVNLDEQLPEDETMSEHSSANQSYNDDTSSQYSSSSRRERNLYSSLKAQKYYESKRDNNNGDSIDFGFDSTYETLRRKRKSYTDDEDGYRAISPGGSSGKSDFTYSKPRLLRRSDRFPGVGREVEDDYPRWTPKSPTARERDYGLSVALPP